MVDTQSMICAMSARLAVHFQDSRLCSIGDEPDKAFLVNEDVKHWIATTDASVGQSESIAASAHPRRAGMWLYLLITMAEAWLLTSMAPLSREALGISKSSKFLQLADPGLPLHAKGV